VLAIAFYPNVFAQTCDVVIKNGSVMDPETNYDCVRNVGIKQSAQVARDKDDE
jgi:N-acyl-D-glutamate deacylase